MLVVTAPTSNIGHRVLDAVLATDQPVRVIARDPAKLPAAVHDRAEIVAGSHSAAAVVEHAFAGADAVFWLVPADPQAPSALASYVEFARPATAAIRRHGVDRLVVISALGRGTAQLDRAGYVTASVAMTDMLSGTGVSMRTLALPGFMDNTLRDIATVKARGVVYGLGGGERKLPTVAVRDIAAVAARLLLDPSWTGQQDVSLLGPEDLSSHDRVAIMSEVLGTPVRYEQIPAETLDRQLTEHGLSAPMAQAMIDMTLAKTWGLDNGVLRTDQNAIDTPTTFRQWCADTLAPAMAAA